MTPMAFVRKLASAEFPHVFNPYRDRCPIHDLPEGPSIRQQNLVRVLEAVRGGRVDSIWVGRDLGHRGGRRTGLALTDEASLPLLAATFDVTILRATRGEPVAERTAAVVWQARSWLNQNVFMWNAFPLHPHEPSNPLSNRCHTRAERAAMRPLFSELLDLLQPGQVVAIGKDASVALAELGVAAVSIRHPSYGGQNEFLDGVADLYRVPSDRRSQREQMKLKLDS